MEKIIKSVIILLIMVSCVNKKDYNFINYNSNIKYDTIKKTELNRGVIKLNRFYLNDNCLYIYKVHYPKWIKDLSSPDFKSSNYTFKPSILDIETPYVLFKRQKDSMFYIIKNNDTLQFKIVEF